jgi:hypothetical protein
MMPTVREIEAMDRTALIAAWEQVFAIPVPKRLSIPFLRRFIAFEVQTRQATGLPKGFVSKLGKAMREGASAKSPALKPGGRLIREWNGVTHIVEVCDEGFMWRGERYRSLSPIACAITGAHWSGPRFFGLSRSSRS